jgi:proline iminopeptidase
LDGLLVFACALLTSTVDADPAQRTSAPNPGYFDNSGRTDAWSGGVRMIPITTSRGTFRVWTKRVGNNPRIKVLLLHGGPGMTHEYLEAVDSYFPAAGIEYYYYDQLGSAYSDQPKDDDLWTVPRFVDEVEQVRHALGLGPDNFYLYGQSWGGLLALEYALAYQQHLKGLVISNMVTNIPEYNEYAKKVLMPQMDQKALAEILALEARKDFADPRYEELLMQYFYVDHILRAPADQWPEPVLRSLAHLNHDIYVLMQGPSELGSSGRLDQWNRTADLAKITVPTLIIGARHDTMDPRHMEMMASRVRHGRYLYCPNGSHFALYDDQKVYFDGLLAFIRDVDAGRF